jgi:hypothetical protein
VSVFHSHLVYALVETIVLHYGFFVSDLNTFAVRIIIKAKLLLSVFILAFESFALLVVLGLLKLELVESFVEDIHCYLLVETLLLAQTIFIVDVCC